MPAVSEICKPESRFFLKSEYGPISPTWPVLAYSTVTVKYRIQRDYDPRHDFVLTVGTSTKETLDPAHRSRLLSLVVVDKTKIFRTESVVAPEEWKWATENHPGQWKNAFKIFECWNVAGHPAAREVLGANSTYSKMGQSRNRGSIVPITSGEKDLLLGLQLEKVNLPTIQETDESVRRIAILRDKTVNSEAVRIAGLVFNRVRCSGLTFEHRGPVRTAPIDFILQVAEKLKHEPLECDLCGGQIELGNPNRLLQASPDRIDSSKGEYGPQNFELTHLACNLGKNNASVADFQEWLELVRSVHHSD